MSVSSKNDTGGKGDMENDDDDGKSHKWTEMNRGKKKKIMDNLNRKEWEIGSFAAIRQVLPVKGGI